MLKANLIVLIFAGMLNSPAGAQEKIEFGGTLDTSKVITKEAKTLEEAKEQINTLNLAWANYHHDQVSTLIKMIYGCELSKNHSTNPKQATSLDVSVPKAIYPGPSKPSSPKEEVKDSYTNPAKN